MQMVKKGAVIFVMLPVGSLQFPKQVDKCLDSKKYMRMDRLRDTQMYIDTNLLINGFIYSNHDKEMHKYTRLKIDKQID